MDEASIFADNPLCRMFGIRYPVFQAGMGHVAYGDLAAAVSEAGGMGVIGTGYMSGEELRAEIDKVRARTDRPFGVDILFARVEGRDATSVEYTAHVQALIDVTLDERVPVLVSGLGDPAGVIAQAHAQGMRVMSVVGNVRQARRMAEQGVDVIVASGADGGGHVGRVGTAVLVPAVADAVSVPVIAGGGIADGRGLVAALALGASGVWMGTRFIATREARGHDNYKHKLVEIGDEGTIVTRAHSGKTCRLVRNAFTDYWEAHAEQIQPHPHQLAAVGHPASLKGRIEGDVEHGVLPAGQSVAMIHEVLPAGEVVRNVVREAERIIGAWRATAPRVPAARRPAP
ncbi:MAG: nitronate monooxygenase [Candidatus Lambdaproteobacteria bacterium]|nr:nitronate monooxygenase [Candidatus Lambdaproteobacteria bacterium]